MVICLYFPGYPALAARLALRERGDVVVQRNGRVLALTPGARAAGMHEGMPIERAVTLLPGICITERDAARERAVWDMVIDRLFGFTPLLRSEAIGEVYCAVRDTEHVMGIVRAMQGQAGTAPTPTLAFLAALHAAPAHLVRVGDDIPRFLSAWKVDGLLAAGYSADLVQRLKLFGLTSLTHLQHLTERHFQAQFGAEGLRLHALLRSISARKTMPIHLPAPVLAAREYFEERQREPGVLETALHHVLDGLLQRLHPQHASRIEVLLLDKADADVARGTRILKTTADDATIRTAAKMILRDMMSAYRWCHGIEVRLKGLHTPPMEQTVLFRERPSADTVARMVLRRFPHGLVRAQCTHTESYLPEKTFSLTPYENLPGTD